MVQPHAGKRDWELALEGLDFPVSLSEITKRARDVGGIDREVHEMIGRLDRGRYESLADLLGDIRQLYIADGVPPDASPV